MIILWFVLTLIVHNRKTEILAEILSQLSDRISGNLEDTGNGAFPHQGFPNISVTLKNVTLKDSLYPVHKHALLNVQASIRESEHRSRCCSNKVDIKEVSLKDGNICIYTDSTGFFQYLPTQRKREPPNPLQESNPPSAA